MSYCLHQGHTECVTDLDEQSEMIIFESLLTTFKARDNFKGRYREVVNNGTSQL